MQRGACALVAAAAEKATAAAKTTTTTTAPTGLAPIMCAKYKQYQFSITAHALTVLVIFRIIVKLLNSSTIFPWYIISRQVQSIRFYKPKKIKHIRTHTYKSTDIKKT